MGGRNGREENEVSLFWVPIQREGQGFTLVVSLVSPIAQKQKMIILAFVSSGPGAVLLAGGLAASSGFKVSTNPA